jgi:ABC-type bacteriocin/lantibiotic exporter with double-glycine peptidase domain
MNRRRVAVVLTVSVALLVVWNKREALGSRAGAYALGAVYLGDSAVHRQKSLQDCGVAALHMLFDTHHRPFAAGDSLLAVVKGRDRGLSFAEMATIARGAGLSAHGYEMNLDALARMNGPTIAHLKTHYVVVDRVRRDSVDIRDPLLGRLRLPASRFQQEWSGRVLVVLDSASGMGPERELSRRGPGGA